jgi:acetoin utilization deacetylase AcuC-like enzyme
MRAYYCDSFPLPLPIGHAFPMEKYSMLRAAVAAKAQDFGIELIEPESATDADLLRVHCPHYVERVMRGTLTANEQRKIGFPWSIQMAQRSRRVSGASKMALQCALQGDGVAVNLAGGTHHAFFDSGGGYCIFNDAVIAARAAQAADLVQRILIIDLDVHQGNGTAALCEHDPTITTFSMHAARNYPAVKQRSDIDIELADGTADQEYLAILALQLPRALALARPGAVIYLAGADPFEQDRLGYLKLSKTGLLARDRMVFDACFDAQIPVAVTMAGGYAHNVADIVEIHLNTVCAAAELANRWR